MKINLPLFSLLIILPTLAWGQAKISGKVTDIKGKTIPGVSIYIKGSYDGSTSDANGNYSFLVSTPGTDTLVASFIGYVSYTKVLIVSAQPITIDIVMKEKANNLNVVTISAGSFEASDENKTTVLKPLDIVTTAGGNGDITGALKTLPGTQQVNGQTGLFVRGGTAEETQTFIDGLRVNNPYFSSVPDIASRGRFSPFLFKGTVFTSGGFSALYGDALSAALILETQDFPDRSSASLSFSSVGIGAGFQNLSKDKKFSWGINVNYTNLAPYLELAKTSVDYHPYPVYYNIEGNFRKRFKKGGLIKFYGYLNRNQVAIERDSSGAPQVKQRFELENTDVYSNINYKKYIGTNTLYIGGSYSYNHDNIHINSIVNDSSLPSIHITPITQVAEGRVVFTHFFNTLSNIKLGGDYEYDHVSTGFVAPPGFTSPYYYRADTWSENHTALFAESDIYFTNKLVGRIGLRSEYSSIINKSDLAPRLSLAYKTGQHSQLSLAYGDFYEKPFNQYLYTNSPLTFQRATHYIANYQILTSLFTFRVEGYYKQYDDLIKTYPAYNNSGNGYAKGVELFWRDKKSIKNFDYWISYSYLDTKRNWLNYPALVQPTFAAKHTASLVLKKYIAKISTSLSATYSFATGFPYASPGDTGTNYLKARTPDYSSLNLSASYLTTLFKAFTVVVVGVNNVTNTKNVYTYIYSADGKTRETVGPVVNRFVFIGLFMSFGIDRRQDVLDNN